MCYQSGLIRVVIFNLNNFFSVIVIELLPSFCVSSFFLKVVVTISVATVTFCLESKVVVTNSVDFYLDFLLSF